MDLTAIINPAARQHHGHAFTHLGGVADFIHSLDSPWCQQVTAAVLQDGEKHGGLSEESTPPTSSSSLFNGVSARFPSNSGLCRYEW